MLNFIGTAIRLCNSNGEWETPIVTNCSSLEYRALVGVMTEVHKNYLYNSCIVMFNIIFRYLKLQPIGRLFQH